LKDYQQSALLENSIDDFLTLGRYPYSIETTQEVIIKSNFDLLRLYLGAKVVKYGPQDATFVQLRYQYQDLS